METQKERMLRQRAARDEHLAAVEASLVRAADAIEDSRREIQRSRDIMNDQRAENSRQDAADDSPGP